jgi:hypothetical protein
MRPFAKVREWWLNRQYSKTKEEDYELPQPGQKNTTFKHQSWCRKPQNPCLCFPSYKTDTGVVREFWVTPHPNRKLRRRIDKLVRTGEIKLA